MNFSYTYPRPAVTVDILIIARNIENNYVLLIQRDKPPFEDCYALPGGFMDMHETLEEAAYRELCEETGLKIKNLQQLHAFSAPDRDPRGRTITIVFYAVINGECPSVKAGDDARKAIWSPITDLPELAFDHREIIDRALMQLAFDNQR